MLGLQETMSAGAPTTKTYSCVACSATFQTLASLLVHQASHANAASHQPESMQSTCVNCGSILANPDLLEKHHCIVLPTPASQKMHVCDCGETFDAITAYEDHKKLHKHDTQVSSNLDGIPKALSSEMEPHSKTGSSHPASSQVSSRLSDDCSSQETLEKSASSAFEANCFIEEPNEKSAPSASKANCSNKEPSEFSASKGDHFNEEPPEKSASSAFEADHFSEEPPEKSASSVFEADHFNKEPPEKSASSASEADCLIEGPLEKSAVSASEADCSNDEPLVKSASSTSEANIKEIASTTDSVLPVENKTSSEQDQSALKPHESPSSHPVPEEQEKDSDMSDTSSTSHHSEHDSEKSTDSSKESDAVNRKSVLKMLASAYMSHRQPAQIKPEQTRRNLPPRKVAPRAPVQVATAIVSKTLENQSETKGTETVLHPSGPAVNVKTVNMLSKKKKIISVIQTLWPVVALETRQKLLGKDNVEGRHKCGLCRRVFQDIDSLIMHHAQHKRERVKFCLCCQQFVVRDPENHSCFGTYAEKLQSFHSVGNNSQNLNSPTTEQTQKLFSCSLCKRSYMWKCNLKRHKCPIKATLKCSTLGNKVGEKHHGLKDECNRKLQDPNINQLSTQQVNAAVGTEPIKAEEQGTEYSIVGENETVLTTQSQSPGPEDQSHSPEPSEPINSIPTESTNTEKRFELSASVTKMEADNKDTFGEKQWTMPLDDAEIDVLIDVDQEDLDNEDILADMTKEDHDEDEDVVIVEASEDMKLLLPSDGFQVHVTDEGLKRFVCSGCQRSYSRRFTLIQHLKICGASKLKQRQCFVNALSSVPGPIKKFPCPQCDKFFSRKDNMNMHRRKCHPINTSSLVGHGIVESKMQPAQENVFVLSPSTESPTVRQESSRNGSSSWGIMSLPSVLPRRVTCECGSSFTCPRLLFEHLQLHAQESYICPHCGENLQSWMDFEAHQQLHGQSQSQPSEQREPQLHPNSFSQVTQSFVPTQEQPHPFSQATQLPVSNQQQPHSFAQVTQSHVPTQQQPHSFSQATQSYVSTQRQPHSFAQVTQSHVQIQQQPHSFSQFTQSHVPLQQQPLSFSQVSQSHVSTHQQARSVSQDTQSYVSTQRQPHSFAQVTQSHVPIQQQPHSFSQFTQSHVPLQQQPLSFSQVSQSHVSTHQQARSVSQDTQSHVSTQQQPHSYAQVTQSHVPIQQQPHSFSQVTQSHVPAQQQPHSFSQVPQSHVPTQQKPHSLCQVTQSHVPTQQQPCLFSQVVESHIPMGPQQSPGFQASALNFNGPPSALFSPQTFHHKQFPERVTCHRCKKTFARRRSLLRHLRLSCRGDATGQVKPSVDIQSNTFKSSLKPIRCPVCVRWFSCVDGLKRHLVSHSRQPILSCQLCDHNCSSLQALEDHKRNVHGINRTVVPANEIKEVCKASSPQSTPTDFQCHICLRYYPKLKSLKDHVRKVHRLKLTELRIHLGTTDPIRSGPFQCQICMRTYSSIKSLKNHRRKVHHIVGGVFQPARGMEQNHTSNQFQFHCQICGRSYPDIGSLRNHRRRVHRILGGLEQLKGIVQQSQHNLYKCQICQRSYPDLVSLKNHRRRVHHILGPVSETLSTKNDIVDALVQKQSDSPTYL